MDMNVILCMNGMGVIYGHECVRDRIALSADSFPNHAPPPQITRSEILWGFFAVGLLNVKCVP